jgi:hypothetical protein
MPVKSCGLILTDGEEKKGSNKYTLNSRLFQKLVFTTILPDQYPPFFKEGRGIARLTVKVS